MNKADLVARVAKQTGYTRVLVEGILSEAFHTIRKSVKKGEDVKVVGFGTFTKIQRQARKGHNPTTGQSMQLPATWTPRFRPGLDFKKDLQSPTRGRRAKKHIGASL